MMSMCCAPFGGQHEERDEGSILLHKMTTEIDPDELEFEEMQRVNKIYKSIH
jgi:hypothetical protein